MQVGRGEEWALFLEGEEKRLGGWGGGSGEAEGGGHCRSLNSSHQCRRSIQDGGQSAALPSSSLIRTVIFILSTVRLLVFHDFGGDDNETEEKKHLLPQDEVLQPRWKYHSYF